jgi:hypothetical protein
MYNAYHWVCRQSWRLSWPCAPAGWISKQNKKRRKRLDSGHQSCLFLLASRVGFTKVMWAMLLVYDVVGMRRTYAERAGTFYDTPSITGRWGWWVLTRDEVPAGRCWLLGRRGARAWLFCSRGLIIGPYLLYLLLAGTMFWTHWTRQHLHFSP